jgi:hypothetical protein
MDEQGRWGRSLICTEARAHVVARPGGRWVSARTRGRLERGLIRGDTRVDHARRAVTRGRLARSDYT